MCVHVCVRACVRVCYCNSELPDYNSPADSHPDAASRYRAALETHFKVLGQCAEFDPVDCARYLRSKRHMSSSIVKEIERAEAAKGRAEVSSRLVTHLSELSDTGVCYFVNHYLAGSGLENISSTIRHCPGPDICTLDAAECHFNPVISTHISK